MEIKRLGLNFTLIVLGMILFGWGVAAMLVSIFAYNPNQILWNCYIGLLLIGLGIFLRNSKLIGSQVAILFIPLMVWNIDFIYQAITNVPLWGITDYLFTGDRLAISQIISLQHLFTPWIAIYCMYKIKVKRFDFWKVSFVQLALLFVIIALVTPPEQNVSCVFENCMSINFSILSGIPWTIIWFTAFFGMVLITNFVLSKLKFLKSPDLEKGMFYNLK